MYPLACNAINVGPRGHADRLQRLERQLLQVVVIAQSKSKGWNANQTVAYEVNYRGSGPGAGASNS